MGGLVHLIKLCVLGLFVFHQMSAWAEDEHASIPEQPVIKALTKNEAKTLLLQFKKAQYSELQAYYHRKKLEYREFQLAEDTKNKQWKKKEDDAKAEYYKEHTLTSERAEYLKGLLDRRKAFNETLDEERSLWSRSRAAEETALKDRQKANLEAFQQELDQGRTPSKALWPELGK